MRLHLTTVKSYPNIYDELNTHLHMNIYPILLQNLLDHIQIYIHPFVQYVLLLFTHIYVVSVREPVSINYY